jgi:hypothetical protein
VETVEFFSEKFTLPFPSAQDLATQAAADLTRALLHPQPAGPFCKVGDEQTIALKRLANIFEGVTRQKSKTTLTPTDGIENTAPQRVQTTAEAEIGAVFINAKDGAVLLTTLEELGHPQPPTPMETDNTTATGYSNVTIKQKRTKAMDMRFY